MNHTLKLFILCTVFLNSFAQAARTSPQSLFRDGDIIFHKSQSRQSAALQEATGSPWTHVGILFSNGTKWYVAEAVEPVRLTALNTFINRGKNKEYRVYRHKVLDTPNTSAKLEKLKEELSGYMNISYDIFFEWSDDLIYCSELIYKAFYDSLNVEVGVVQKIGELKLDGPQVKKLIKDRLDRIGRKLNLNEPIVTPISQMQDSELRVIYVSR
jgi:hypothetical protein